MPKLPTWANKSTFSYTGNVNSGTEITFGAGYCVFVSAAQYTALLNHFRNQTVEIGTSRTTPPQGSVGEWLLSNVTKTAIASYIGPILIDQGYARKMGRTQIQFI